MTTFRRWLVRVWVWWARYVIGFHHCTMHSVDGRLQGLTVSHIRYRWLHRDLAVHECRFIEPPSIAGSLTFCARCAAPMQEGRTL